MTAASAISRPRLPVSPLPAGLGWLADFDDGRRWLASLPGLVAACAADWRLSPDGPPYPGGFVSLVIPVRTRDGGQAALKVSWPGDRESDHEPDALACWGGRGAVRLLGRDPGRRAMLLERAEPGVPLSSAPADEALSALAVLVPEILVPVHGGGLFRTLDDEAARWAASLPDGWDAAGHPFPRRLLDAALAHIADLRGGDGRPPVLLHQDLHGGNILSAARSPWLVIDPKPLSGERSFAAAPLVRTTAWGHSRRDVVYRLDRLCGDLGLDRERARKWAVAQTAAWSLDSPLPEHVEAAGWLEDAGG